MKDTIALILAAGKGTRMKSKFPKVLHKVGGVPMVEQVLRVVKEAGTQRQIVVVGFGGEVVQEYLGDQAETVMQPQQLGTGHAVLQAEPLLQGVNGTLLVTCGDTPLVTADTFKQLLDCHERSGASATVLTAVLPDAAGYGRVIRDAAGQVVKIVEQKDGTPEELAVHEVNAGIYCFDMSLLWKMLHSVTNNNAQGEYYLTDIIGMLVSAGKIVSAFAAPDYKETLGVNSRAQMAEAEGVLRYRKLVQLMADGVSVIDVNNTYVDTTVTVGRDTVLYPGTILEGATVIGEDCQVGPYVRMTNVKMGDQDHLQFTYAHDCEIKNGCEIGPFVHFRPNTVIGNDVKVGNYMEVKNSSVGDGTKLPHLSYIGDSDVGSGVNIGCGTITVNYDGKIKHRTTIGNHAFVGCNSNLVAPVSVGEYAYVGAGSTITKNVPDKALSVARARQRNIEGWVKDDTYKK
ncbi:MAG: bifunctional UDP-N-acetylglucosamine diphosphorylase/glucosamine-1-phosphate N-acetyltransferase GlmU [Megasphaera sp.]|jgi:bifunctional UDP-N-acetylglucosamine pyrophosphorylase/glucosamine-1-phosphate N-acetyltransferase|nr:bifunctional UDP-N-acetylglucosamine diphosphorylase/glucosamine-1-phosphate N-acetyltransferase GlmU [Megasphaera sp.]MCH4187721.1 bifunctional UDP-N-acetylglucosamine diphosphorylase/glucosamine-1-phosphate N-acetyltransferase GlmU [Megasphaera sp.]MCH4217620.1 bifunctional UDP-N-acetylglucosamine diphosphorylase/glucosamine-1-phosphate N-acetyltransferase GlmU [Megasphaera sp.]